MIGYIKQGMSCTKEKREKILNAGYKARQKKRKAQLSYDNLDTTIKAQSNKIKAIGQTKSEQKEKIELIKRRRKNIRLRKQWKKDLEEYKKAEAAQDKMNNENICDLKF